MSWVDAGRALVGRLGAWDASFGGSRPALLVCVLLSSQLAEFMNKRRIRNMPPASTSTKPNGRSEAINRVRPEWHLLKRESCRKGL